MVSASAVLTVLGLTASVGAVVTGFAWRHRHRPGGFPLFLLMVAVTWWTVAYVGELTATVLSTKLLWARLQWFGSVWVPLAWLLFAMEFTGHDEYISTRRVVLLSVLPAVLTLLAWTNPLHHLIRYDVTMVQRGGLAVLSQSWGPAFWVTIAYTYLLAFIGSFLLLRLALRSTALFWDQIASMLVAALAPWISNILYISNVGVLAGVDPTPVAFTVSGLASLGAITRFRLLQVSTVPDRLVGEFVVSGMEDGVVVVDTDGRIADLNHAAELIIGETEVVGRQAADLVPGYLAVDDRGDDRTVVAVDQDNQDRYYDVRRSTLRDHHERRIGTVLVLRDVTEARRHEQRLDVLNRVLRHNLRNEMNVLSGYAESVRAGTIDATRFAGLVEERARDVVELGEKARTIEEMLGEREDEVDVSPTLARVVDRVAADHPDVSVRLGSSPGPVWAVDWAIEPILESLIENAAEHNRQPDPEVQVEASVEGSRLLVRVKDTGPGLPAVERSVLQDRSETPTKHGRGLGLWLASWGIRELGGSLSFEQRSPTGTVVTVEVPVRRRSLPPAPSEEPEQEPVDAPEA